MAKLLHRVEVFRRTLLVLWNGAGMLVERVDSAPVVERYEPVPLMSMSVSCATHDPCQNGGVCTELSSADLKDTAASSDTIVRLQNIALATNLVERDVNVKLKCICSAGFSGEFCEQLSARGHFLHMSSKDYITMYVAGAVASCLLVILAFYLLNVLKRDTEGREKSFLEILRDKLQGRDLKMTSSVQTMSLKPSPADTPRSTGNTKDQQQKKTGTQADKGKDKKHDEGSGRRIRSVKKDGTSGGTGSKNHQTDGSRPERPGSGKESDSGGQGESQGQQDHGQGQSQGQDQGQQRDPAVNHLMTMDSCRCNKSDDASTAIWRQDVTTEAPSIPTETSPSPCLACQIPTGASAGGSGTSDESSEISQRSGNSGRSEKSERSEQSGRSEHSGGSEVSGKSLWSVSQREKKPAEERRVEKSGKGQETMKSSMRSDDQRIREKSPLQGMQSGLSGDQEGLAAMLTRFRAMYRENRSENIVQRSTRENRKGKPNLERRQELALALKESLERKFGTQMKCPSPWTSYWKTTPAECRPTEADKTKSPRELTPRQTALLGDVPPRTAGIGATNAVKGVSEILPTRMKHRLEILPIEAAVSLLPPRFMPGDGGGCGTCETGDFGNDTACRRVKANPLGPPSEYSKLCQRVSAEPMSDLLFKMMPLTCDDMTSQRHDIMKSQRNVHYDDMRGNIPCNNIMSKRNPPPSHVCQSERRPCGVKEKDDGADEEHDAMQLHHRVSPAIEHRINAFAASRSESQAAGRRNPNPNLQDCDCSTHRGRASCHRQPPKPGVNNKGPSDFSLRMTEAPEDFGHEEELAPEEFRRVGDSRDGRRLYCRQLPSAESGRSSRMSPGYRPSMQDTNDVETECQADNITWRNVDHCLRSTLTRCPDHLSRDSGEPSRRPPVKRRRTIKDDDEECSLFANQSCNNGVTPPPTTVTSCHGRQGHYKSWDEVSDQYSRQGLSSDKMLYSGHQDRRNDLPADWGYDKPDRRYTGFNASREPRRPRLPAKDWTSVSARETDQAKGGVRNKTSSSCENLSGVPVLDAHQHSGAMRDGEDFQRGDKMVAVSRDCQRDVMTSLLQRSREERRDVRRDELSEEMCYEKACDGRNQMSSDTGRIRIYWNAGTQQ